jgi:Fe-S cluster biogenesis protein NfuA
MGFLDKMRDWASGPESDARDASDVDDAAADARADEGGFLEVSFSQPPPDAVTCPIRFDRPVSPGGTSLFETPDEAAAWPAVRALLGIPGVHSVIGKGDVLVVARHDSASWADVLGRVQPALVEAFSDVRAPEAPAHAARSAQSPEASDLRARVQAVIERDINPAVADHGGYITLLDVQDTRVFIHMGGGCQGCAMSTATLKNGVETMLRAQVPEITEILDTTDHAAGENPYFAG